MYLEFFCLIFGVEDDGFRSGGDAFDSVHTWRQQRKLLKIVLFTLQLSRIRTIDGME
jgi:hypothetical protein